ncbi:hypothetical protein ACHAQA_002314 [Verticillium albo-atrum]
MAEVLGIVTGSIALLEVASRLGGRVLKLKQLLDEVQEIPETIRDLLEQMEVVDSMLAQMDGHLNPSAATSSTWPMLQNDTFAIQSFEYCRRTNNELAKLIDDLSADIAASKRSKRGLAKAKVYLKKDSMERCEKRMQKALFLVQLAQTSYTA